MKQRANELPSPLKGRGLLGIDGPPEKKQPFNERAKQTTSALSFGQYVTVRSAGKDRHGCTLRTVELVGERNALILRVAVSPKAKPIPGSVEL